MSETVARALVKIVNPQGLHARPADMFVKTANEYASQINIVKDGECVNGKSILDVLTLVAEQGTELSIEAKGPDADAALRALAALIEDGFVGADDEQPEKA